MTSSSLQGRGGPGQPAQGPARAPRFTPLHPMLGKMACQDTRGVTVGEDGTFLIKTHQPGDSNYLHCVDSLTHRLKSYHFAGRSPQSLRWGERGERCHCWETIGCTLGSPGPIWRLAATPCPQAPARGRPGQMVAAEQLSPPVPASRAAPENRCFYQPRNTSQSLQPLLGG